MESSILDETIDQYFGSPVRKRHLMRSDSIEDTIFDDPCAFPKLKEREMPNLDKAKRRMRVFRPGNQNVNLALRKQIVRFGN